MAIKKTPTLNGSGKIFDKHIPDRLQDAALNATYARTQMPKTLASGAQIAAPYDASRQIYNAHPGQLLRTRKKIAQLLNGGTGRFKVLAVGDSNTEGNGAVKSLTSWPAHLHRLAVGAGLPDAGGGVSYIRRCEQWNFGDWVALGQYAKHGRASATVGAAYFTSIKAGTSIDLWYDATSPAFTIFVDGSTGYTPPVSPSGKRIEKFTISGLTDAKHSITINPSAAGVKVYGVEVYRATGISVTNAGISGSNTNDWKPTATDADSALKVAAAWEPDLVYVNLATNDPTAGISAATHKANLLAILSYFPNAEVVFGTSLPRPDTDPDMKPYALNEYELSDSLGLRLLDLNDRWFPYNSAYSAGYYSDSLHGNPTSYMDVARAVAELTDIPVGTQAQADPSPIPAPPGTLLVGDSFTRANGALGTTETGSKAWAVVAGDVTVTGNRMVVKSTTQASSTGARAYVDSGVSDGAVETTIYPAATNQWGMGIAFRQDWATFSGWTVESFDVGPYKLYKSTGAGVREIVASSTRQIVWGDRIRVELNGSSIVVKVNGITIMTATDTFNVDKTQHGVIGRGGGRPFDDFQIRALVPATETRITSDTFSGADTTTMAGRMTDTILGGTGKIWEMEGSNTARILSGKFVRGTDMAVGSTVFNIAAKTDLEIGAKIESVTSSGAIYLDLLRDSVASSATAYRAAILVGNTVKVTRRVGGVNTDIITAVSFTPGDRIALRKKGSTIELKINGAVVGSATDTGITAAGYAGFAYLANTVWTVDDVTFDDAI